MISQKE